MDGIVNKVHIASVGAVIKSGQEILQIVPSTKSLLIEAAISPADVAFIRPNQDAVVKVTAYDFAIYGGLEGRVVSISPDTHTTEDGNAFYKVQVRTEHNYIGNNKDNLIIPGMAVEMDLISSQRNLLSYLLKPLNRVQQKALTEP
jgi:adhesin transport system membrane fusion protein